MYPLVSKHESSIRDLREPWTVEWQPSTARQRWARYLTWGGACICVAPYLPWVIARYESGWGSWTGMQLTYAHFPPVTIGYVPLVLGALSVLLGRADARRPGYAGLGVLPAGLMVFLLWFINSSLHGHFGEQIQSITGFSGAWLGPGYWLMMIGTGLIVVGTTRVLSTPIDGSLPFVLLESRIPSTDVATHDEHPSAHKQLQRSSASSRVSRE
jgi:hypothetical protein